MDFKERYLNEIKSCKYQMKDIVRLSHKKQDDLRVYYKQDNRTPPVFCKLC